MNADASLDESFSPAWAFPAGYPLHFWPGSLMLLTNGMVVVGGGFSDCGVSLEPCWYDQNFGAMVRFDSGGTPDLSFDPLAARIYGSEVEPLAALADGSVLARHGRYSGDRLRKILPNGTPDPGFLASSTDGGKVRAALVQRDGLIVAAGSFTHFNGLTRRYLAGLHPDGSVDSCFDAGASVDGAVSGILLQPDGQWLLFGSFTSIGVVRRTGLALARWEDFCLRAFADPAGGGTNLGWIVSGPTNRLVSLEWSTDLVRWERLGSNTLSGEGWRILTSNAAPRAFYRAKLLSGNLR